MATQPRRTPRRVPPSSRRPGRGLAKQRQPRRRRRLSQCRRYSRDWICSRPCCAGQCHCQPPGSCPAFHRSRSRRLRRCGLGSGPRGARRGGRQMGREPQAAPVPGGARYPLGVRDRRPHGPDGPRLVAGALHGGGRRVPGLGRGVVGAPPVPHQRGRGGRDGRHGAAGVVTSRLSGPDEPARTRRPAAPSPDCHGADRRRGPRDGAPGVRRGLTPQASVTTASGAAPQGSVNGGSPRRQPPAVAHGDLPAVGSQLAPYVNAAGRRPRIFGARGRGPRPQRQGCGLRPKGPHASAAPRLFWSGPSRDVAPFLDGSQPKCCALFWGSTTRASPMPWRRSPMVGVGAATAGGSLPRRKAAATRPGRSRSPSVGSKTSPAPPARRVFGQGG